MQKYRKGIKFGDQIHFEILTFFWKIPTSFRFAIFLPANGSVPLFVTLSCCSKVGWKMTLALL